MPKERLLWYYKTHCSGRKEHSLLSHSSKMILDLIFNTYYWSIALGILVLGDIVVVPGLFFSVTGKLDFITTASIIFIANLVSDVIWYWIGGLIPKEKLEKFFLFRHKKGEIGQEPSLFKIHGMKILFLSKFVY